MSARNWCITINNPIPDDYACFKEDGDVFTYWGWADETGESGTRHIQAFCVLKKKSRLPAVKKLFPRAHLEVMRGKFSENEAYCSKEGVLTVFGTPPGVDGEVEKVRWDMAKDAMKRGALDELPSDIFVRYYKTAKLIAKDHMQKPLPLDGVCGKWIWGAPGTGKTHVVVMTYPDRYIKPLNKWWDGYQGEDVVHLDEIEPAHANWIAPFLKKWADKWPFDAETKGGAMQIRPKKIFVTSNYSIEQMGFDEVTRDAIKRRFIEVEKHLNQNIII